MISGADIRFVYFDLGNILLSFDVEIAHAHLAKLFGVSALDAKAAVYDSGLEDRFEHGEMAPEAFAARVCKAIGVTGNPPPVEDVLDAISDMFTPIETMVSVMDRVRRNGRGVGILSNTCHAHWEWIRRQNYEVMAAELDATILSYQIVRHETRRSDLRSVRGRGKRAPIPDLIHRRQARECERRRRPRMAGCPMRRRGRSNQGAP